MSSRIRAAFQVVVWLAAANFALLVGALLAALATGAVDAERVGAAAGVLGGSASAVPAEELAALREARSALRDRGEEATLVEAAADLKAERATFDMRKARETDALEALRDEAKGDLAAITEARRGFAAERARREQERLDREEAVRRSASDKIRRVYRYMRPAEVARDLEVRLAAGQENEVAELVRAMNDRAAAEVLEAMVDPASRMRVYDALAGIGGPGQRP